MTARFDVPTFPRLRLRGERQYARYDRHARDNGLTMQAFLVVNALFKVMRYDRVRAIEKYCLAAAATVSIAATVVVAFSPKQVAIAFMSDSTLEKLAMAVNAQALLTHLCHAVCFVLGTELPSRYREASACLHHFSMHGAGRQRVG